MQLKFVYKAIHSRLNVVEVKPVQQTIKKLVGKVIATAE